MMRYIDIFLLHFYDSFLIKSTTCTSPNYKGFSCSSLFAISQMQTNGKHRLLPLDVLNKSKFAHYFCAQFAIESGHTREAIKFIIHQSVNSIQHINAYIYFNKHENGFEYIHIFIDLHHLKCFFTLVIRSYFMMWA